MKLTKYVINWERVKTVDDIKRLIKATEISFTDGFKNIEQIRDLVDYIETDEDA